MACPACLTVQRRSPKRLARCVYCEEVFPRKQGVALAHVGFGIAYHGWFYGAAYEVEADRGGTTHRHYLLPEPGTFLWELGNFFAMAIAAGLTWDVIKAVARKIYARHKDSPARGAILTDAEAIQNLQVLNEWAHEHIEHEFPGKHLRRELKAPGTVTPILGRSRRILRVQGKRQVKKVKRIRGSRRPPNKRRSRTRLRRKKK